MSTLTSRLRTQGSSTVTTVPTEIVRRLGLGEGDAMSWVEDGFGGYRVSRVSEDIETAIEAHEAIMEKFDSVFRALAK